MKHTICLLVVFSLFAIPLYAQDNIQTKEQNQKWLWDLEVLTLKEQIAKIQKRITSDSASYHIKGRLKTDYSATGIRPMYIVDDAPLTICRGIAADAYTQLIELLNGVKSIKIFQDTQATAIYGSIGGAGGVIVMQTGSSKNVEKLKKLDLVDVPDCM